MAASSSSISATLSGSHHDMVEIFQLLESNDLSVIEETVALVRDNLGSVTEPWLLQGLVEYYIHSGNSRARDLLCMVRQQQHKTLMNKLDDYLQKPQTRLKALTLLGHIIRSEPVWTHCIITTKAFQTVLKYLQVDTELASITSALYVVVTLLPKVASQVSNCLSTLCAIYTRLVSWNKKQASATEVNYTHLHTAVYALFLCLYGMYPCYFLKYLQQYFQTNTSGKGSFTSDGEKSKIFESCVLPMLDQVRFHPRLILDSTDVELSSEKWRKFESQDVVADISKVSLDATENSALKHQVSQNEILEIPPATLQCMGLPRKDSGNEQNSDKNGSFWSPSVAIGLSTPPQSRGISPTPLSQHALEGEQNLDTSTDSPSSRRSKRPTTLSTTEEYSPMRSTPTPSSTTTPVKLFLPSFVSGGKLKSTPTMPEECRQRVKSDSKEYVVINSESAISGNVANEERGEGTTKDMIDRKSSVESNDEAFISDSKHEDDLSKTKPGISDFTPGLLPDRKHNVELDVANKAEEASVVDNFTSAQKLLNLIPSYANKSPNELLDLQMQLLADAYLAGSRRRSTSNKDLEWSHGDGSRKGNSEETSLRSQVLQMHCSLLYERHRREQHSLRARKLMRKVYDTAALEERNKTLTLKVQQLEREANGFNSSERQLRKEMQVAEIAHKREAESLRQQLVEQKLIVEQMEVERRNLEKDKQVLVDECEDLKTDSTRLRSRVFTLEQLDQRAHCDVDKVQEMEALVSRLRSEVISLSQTNTELKHSLGESRSTCKAQVAQTQMLSDAYTKELESTKEMHRRDRCQLDLTREKAEQFESEAHNKDQLLTEQKKYLENVKSLARGQIKAMEAKYNAQKQISQRLEIQVLELYSRPIAEKDLAPMTSAPRLIQSIPAHHAQQQRILSSSPQLSPPIRSAMLANSDAWQKSANGGDRPQDGAKGVVDRHLQ